MIICNIIHFIKRVIKYLFKEMKGALISSITHIHASCQTNLDKLIFKSDKLIIFDTIYRIIRLNKVYTLDLLSFFSQNLFLLSSII